MIGTRAAGRPLCESPQIATFQRRAVSPGATALLEMTVATDRGGARGRRFNRE
jgi:hypothetical protein